MATSTIFLDFSLRKLQQQTGRILHCLAQLDESQIWRRPDHAGNSPGNLVLHLCGNVRQWIISGAGQEPDLRQRDTEFAATAHADLAHHLSATIQEACAVLQNLTEARLLETVHIQGYQVTVLEAVYHVVEHFSGHTGQIIAQTKSFTNQPLDFYAHLGQAHHERTP